MFQQSVHTNIHSENKNNRKNQGGTCSRTKGHLQGERNFYKVSLAMHFVSGASWSATFMGRVPVVVEVPREPTGIPLLALLGIFLGGLCPLVEEWFGCDCKMLQLSLRRDIHGSCGFHPLMLMLMMGNLLHRGEIRFCFHLTEQPYPLVN